MGGNLLTGSRRNSGFSWHIHGLVGGLCEYRSKLSVPITDYIFHDQMAKWQLLGKHSVSRN
jgi:hypothetical protein